MSAGPFRLILTFVSLCLFFSCLCDGHLLQIDRVLAATLPIGRYPVCSPRTSQCLVVLAWLLALALGAGVTSAAGAKFEPSLLLCAPGLPHEFGITLVSLYCSAFASMVIGYVVLIVSFG